MKRNYITPEFETILLSTEDILDDSFESDVESDEVEINGGVFFD